MVMAIRSDRAARTCCDEQRGRAASPGRAGAASVAGAHSGADAARVAEEDRAHPVSLAGSLNAGGAACGALGCAGKPGTARIDRRQRRGSAALLLARRSAPATGSPGRAKGSSFDFEMREEAPPSGEHCNSCLRLLFLLYWLNIARNLRRASIHRRL